ncbi:hypothetical protein EIP86_008828 [Pleurotus ostreatoroseus]|nr:hypothetical protein EIP86_008828 [Pleurotus ostreatoroseus]
MAINSAGSAQTTTIAQTQPGQEPILVVVMGVAGTGKSTLAQALDKRLGMPYIEGDDLHPQSNIDKMAAGHPLTDADREPWLELLRNTAESIAADPTRPTRGVMITCSSLKKYYRDILRGTYTLHDRGPDHIHAHLLPAARRRPLKTFFVYIKGDVPLLRERMAKRQGHFMKPEMLDSQLATLESPEGEEGVVVVPLDLTTNEQVEVALAELKKQVPDLELRPATP